MSDPQKLNIEWMKREAKRMKKESPSPWFTGGAEQGGGYGFVLQDALWIPFLPWKGRLGFFNVDVKL